MTSFAVQMARRFGSVRLLRYVIASAGALGVDFGTYLALLALGLYAPVAAAMSYSLGIAAHWLMSSRAVFVGDVAEGGMARARQKALFVGSALVGLGLTTSIVWGGEIAGLDPRLGKLVAIGASFVVTWVLRSQVVFARKDYGFAG